MMPSRNLSSVLALAVVVAASAGTAVSAGPASADTTPTSTTTAATTPAPTPTPTPAPANPTPPTVSTGGIESISRTGATLTGAINPNNGATSYHYQYGTTTSYGLVTPSVTLPSGASAVTVKQAVSGLTVGTTYHYRLVASNAAGAVNGSDKSFKTQANPKAPSVSALNASLVAPTTASLNARVNPNGQDTSVYFQWGTSTKYGNVTPTAPIGAGTATIVATLPITGLAGNTQYHYRLIATNATGKVTGSDRSFTTPRGLTGVGMSLVPNPTVWGTPAVVSGTVAGAGVGGVGVKLMQQDFPFTGTFVQIATQTSSSAGAYSFTIPKVTAAVKLQVITTTGAVPVTSPVTTLNVKLYTALGITKKTTKSYTATGKIYPAVPHARVQVQRRTPKGRWITLKRVRVHALDQTGSQFKTTLARITKRKSTYRVIVTPHDAGAHLSTTSSTLSVPKRKN